MFYLCFHTSACNETVIQRQLTLVNDITKNILQRTFCREHSSENILQRTFFSEHSSENILQGTFSREHSAFKSARQLCIYTLVCGLFQDEKVQVLKTYGWLIVVRHSFLVFFIHIKNMRQWDLFRIISI